MDKILEEKYEEVANALKKYSDQLIEYNGILVQRWVGDKITFEKSLRLGEKLKEWFYNYRDKIIKEAQNEYEKLI